MFVHGIDVVELKVQKNGLLRPTNNLNIPSIQFVLSQHIFGTVITTTPRLDLFQYGFCIVIRIQGEFL